MFLFTKFYFQIIKIQWKIIHVVDYIIEQKVIPLFMMSSIKMEASRLPALMLEPLASMLPSEVLPLIMSRRRSYSSRYLS